MIGKILGGLVVLILMASTGAIGFYYGGVFSPVSTGLTVLGKIAYDEAAEAEFNTKIGILDAQLAEKEFALSELEQENETLLQVTYTLKEDYSSFSVLVEESRIETKDSFEAISTDLASEIKDNTVASDNLFKLNILFDNEKVLFTDQSNKANEYITSLEKSNKSLITENTLLRSINIALDEELNIMRERIDDISGSRPRHGPGFAMGFNPVDNYQLTMLVGWTISWS